ncbi:MAG TPA: hypothetical protein VFJ52_01795 [Terriglobia bacterium]|nr:hypothetical protein [Terriglobia bacterium]
MNAQALMDLRALSNRAVDEDPKRGLQEIAAATGRLRELCVLPHTDDPKMAALANLVGQLALILGSVVQKAEDAP